MKALVASGLATLLATAAAASAAPPRHGVLVDGRTLGGLRLGATPSAVRRAWGRTFGVCRDCPESTWYFNYRPFQPQGVGVSFRGGRVAALFTLWSPTGWTTSRGLVVGDSATQVATIYGPLPRLECGRYYALQLAQGTTLTTIYLADGKVWGFGLSRIGTTPCR